MMSVRFREVVNGGDVALTIMRSDDGERVIFVLRPEPYTGSLQVSWTMQARTAAELARVTAEAAEPQEKGTPE